MGRLAGAHGRSLEERVRAVVQTPRGIATTALATVVAGASIGAHGFAHAVALFPVSWVAIWIGTAMARHTWESKTHPATPHFARRRNSGDGHMLREDHNGGFFKDHGGFLWTSRTWFVGTGCPPVRIAESHRIELIARAIAAPAAVASAGDRTWWLYEDRFYWENEGYGPEDVRALIVARQKAKDRKLQYAHTMLATDEAPRTRERIPEEVQRFVFRRDGGHCQSCGTNELLQFDHVIPFSIGGSSEPENLQLLCAPCNRAKSASM